jgi:hypothetical protein
MTAPSADVALVVAAVKTELPTRWAQWGGGWPNEVEAALIDAVLSIRNRYGKKPTSGVRGSVGRYRTDRDTVPLDDLDVLAGYSLDRLTAVLDNRQKTGGVPKAQALINAAGVLSTAGIRHAAELNPNSLKHRAAYCSVKGLGPVTWTYFTMLLGQPGVKADTWIVRFTAAALGRPVTSFQAEQLISGAAAELRVSPTDLDHAIWRHLSAKRPSGG